MNIPIDLIISNIKSSEECREYLNKIYEYEYSVWIRFSSKNGDQCPLARAALKRIFQFEHKSRGEDFILSLASQNFGSKGYQEGSHK